MASYDLNIGESPWYGQLDS